MRSVLFVPGHQERRVDKAFTLDADAVILDIEDAVPPSERAAARTIVLDRLASGVGDQVPTYVRINRLTCLDGLRDVLSLRSAEGSPTGLILPMVEFAFEVDQLDRLITEAGLDVDLWVGIETPRGLENLFEILGASPRMRGVLFGGGDYAAVVGTGLDFESLILARSRLAAVSGSFGLPVYDVPYVNVRDSAGLRAEATRVRALGFAGKTVIHPGQIGIVNEVFLPTDEEVEFATKVVEAVEAGCEGAFNVDGRLVDAPIITRSRQILRAIRSNPTKKA